MFFNICTWSFQRVSNKLLKGVDLTFFLGVYLAPLGRCWYDLKIYFLVVMRSNQDDPRDNKFTPKAGKCIPSKVLLWWDASVFCRPAKYFHFTVANPLLFLPQENYSHPTFPHPTCQLWGEKYRRSRLFWYPVSAGSNQLFMWHCQRYKSNDQSVDPRLLGLPWVKLCEV